MDAVRVVLAWLRVEFRRRWALVLIVPLALVIVNLLAAHLVSVQRLRAGEILRAE